MDFISTDFKHITDIQIRFNDVDGFRHINNSIIQEYFDLGRMHYLIDILTFDYQNVNDQNLVIVSNKTDFIKPLHLFDNLKVYTKVYQIGDKSLKMLQWLVNDKEEHPSVTCDSVMAGFISSKEISMVIPDKWRDKLFEYEGHILLKK
jgi:acyl-CoA thioester hydrolase